MNQRLASVLSVALLTVTLTGCSERERIQPTNPTTAAGFVDRGWSSFSSGDFTAALGDFASAIALDEDFGQAYLGQGWARMALATDSQTMLQAVAHFDEAATRGETGVEVDAGRAAAQLGAGGGNLSAADTGAQTALQRSPDFVFSHKSSFDRRDLLLIEAFARAGQSNFSTALAAADQIRDSGIEQSDPGSWVVGNETFASFEAATLAFLHQLSEEFAG